MFKKISLTSLSVIMLVFGVAITAHFLAHNSTSGIPPSPTLSISEEVSANFTTTYTDNYHSKLRTVRDPDISPEVDLDILRYTSKISTKYGDFVRQDKQIISNESEIARELRQVGPDTKQLVLNYGIFLRNDFSK
ncbi:hypothetical protein [Paenibacillus dokdonensis]|uniref:hypothetical protein n=1 Tax=Paenibacillus dokdonensis TaxID=2567944 RepID=UPI0010A790B9|nr:hypothetical protein [Paenibacillus dokdonensis]